MAANPAKGAEPPRRRRRHEHTVLVLQGGGALGAYQAGAYEGLAEAGIVPDWVTGVSIGAINAALIAGNPPGRRVERLRAFWDRVSSAAPVVLPPMLDPLRLTFNRISAFGAVAFGINGFFTPRVPPPYFAADGTPEALSFYDTEPLRRTLEELVDFRLINNHSMRLSVGATKVRTGDSVYFDNRHRSVTTEHIRASGALPPGFPPVTIEGEEYWDGGIVSNSPLWYVLDDSPRLNALIIQVDLFSAKGELPTNLNEVLERAKDIQYSSKTRFNTKRVKELNDLHDVLGRLLEQLPPDLKNSPDGRELYRLCDQGDITIAHLINRRLQYSAQSKDYEFSRTTVNQLWEAGLEDVRQAVAKFDLLQPADSAPGMRVYDLTL
ncbi:MAG TPA: patatin-like phospholipase family protein [Casimicrobiaceae bacterium]|nr:patatin-like phospholipase family protein [Casimicrobiaceae bacterium]